jgi:hypothetical protein
MANATNAEKQKAKRLRKREGALTPTERAWLDSYEQRVKPQARTEARKRGWGIVAPPTEQPLDPRPSIQIDRERADRERAPLTPIALDLSQPLVALDAPPPAAPAAPSPPLSPPASATVPPAPSSSNALAPVPPPTGQTCQIPHCPCKSNLGGQVCLTTGKIVWPPMDPEAAQGVAKGILTGIAFLGSFLREDRRVIKHTADDARTLGRAIQIMQTRRANWVGAIDDIIMIVAVVVAFGSRVMAEPTIKEEKKAA